MLRGIEIPFFFRIDTDTCKNEDELDLNKFDDMIKMLQNNMADYAENSAGKD